MALAAEFNFYGVGLRLKSDNLISEEIIQKLKDDFSFAQQELIDEPEITIEIEGSVKSEVLRRKLFKTSSCSVYGLGASRVCDYGEGTQVHAINSREKKVFKVFSSDKPRLYEVVYLLILSSVGEFLDLKGYHRAHGLGFSLAGLSYLLILPSGGGKSALATLLRKQQGIKFFSDEIPLLKNGWIYPFPLRVALHPKIAQLLGVDLKNKQIFKRKLYPEKVLIPWADSEIAVPQRIDCILIGKKSDQTEIKPSRRSQVSKGLFEAMVLGLGVPQMAEHLLRFDRTCQIPKIGLSRLKENLKLSSQAKAFQFSLGSEIESNFEVLMGFLDKNTRASNF